MSEDKKVHPYRKNHRRRRGKRAGRAHRPNGETVALVIAPAPEVVASLRSRLSRLSQRTA